MKVLVGVIGSDETLYYDLDPARQAYLIQIEGEGMVNGNELDAGDAAEITATREVSVRAKTRRTTLCSTWLLTRRNDFGMQKARGNAAGLRCAFAQEEGRFRASGPRALRGLPVRSARRSRCGRRCRC